MKPPTEHEFGGDWTSEKLLRVSKYLSAYTAIMNKQNFRFAYIDAFAGTGYRTLKHSGISEELLLPELAEPEPQALLDGSAAIALKVEPHFENYIFIEKDGNRARELERLKSEFPHHRNRIKIKVGDANHEILNLCDKNWRRHRAVLFLDPYGMQVNWETIEAIARTKAIDFWYLFPLGIGVNRLLKKDGNIDDSIKNRLNAMLGEEAWFDIFYKVSHQLGFFNQEPEYEKAADFQSIRAYFVNRLRTIFSRVAHNPLELRNSKGNPLYLLCFAAGNPRGAPTAVKIAQHILST